MVALVSCKQINEADVYRKCIEQDDRLCAIHAVTRLLTQSPLDATWNDTLAILYSNVGMTQQAVLAADKALTLRESEAVRLVSASGHKQLGNFDKALDGFRKLVEAHPNDLEFLYENGYLLIRLGRDNEAVAWLDKVLAHPKATTTSMQEFIEQGSQTVPYAAIAHNLKGFIQAKKGMNDDAVRSYEAALGLFPDYFLAKNNLLILRTSMGKK